MHVLQILPQVYKGVRGGVTEVAVKSLLSGAGGAELSKFIEVREAENWDLCTGAGVHAIVAERLEHSLALFQQQACATPLLVSPGCNAAQPGEPEPQASAGT